MAGTEWVTAEQKAFLQGLYSDFLKAQLQATLTAFWTEVYRTWFEKWPEISIMYPDVPDHDSLLEEQNKLLGIAVKKRQQLRNAIDSGSITTKAEKLNTARKLAQEAYTAANSDVQASCMAIVQSERDTKASEVLKHMRAPEERTNTELAKALEECPGPIVHFLQAIHEMTGFHWSILGAGPDPRYNGDINVISYHTGVNEQGQNWMQATPDFNERHLKPFTGFVSRLFPEHMRKMRALSYIPPTPSQQDTSESMLGTERVPEPGMQLFSHSPPRPIPITSGSLSVENAVLPSAPIPSSLLSFDSHDFASSHGSSDYMELLTFGSSYRSSDYMELPTFDSDMYDDNLNVRPSSSTSTSTSSYSLMPYLNSPSSSPISSWNRDARNSQNYTSPPRFRPHDTFKNFHSQTAASDVTQSSLPPFIVSKSPKFYFPPISAPAGSFLDAPQHTTEPLGTESVANAAAATADLESSAGGDSGDLVTKTCNDPRPTADMESVTAIVADVVVPLIVGAMNVADVAAPQTVTPTIVADVVVLPAVRKTGCIRMETTRLVQADNIGQNTKRTRPAAGHAIGSGAPKKRLK
ncbi:hypothetical protein EV702DRAFT_1196285 [Suillus placidus]|uniref:Uncharacterized protein n=1 Tax=Suillus placidus TaxID=48579 RepID=A0A9P7D4K4_9AGAM|nr:hypothetical protein EV702DRAFT_1196285 [Suillus placidus]